LVFLIKNFFFETEILGNIKKNKIFGKISDQPYRFPKPIRFNLAVKSAESAREKHQQISV